MEYESRLMKIIGLTLLKVEYSEINYEPEDPKPYYKTEYKEIDSVDFAILFQTDKEHIEFNWDGEFYQYGIGVKFNGESESAGRQKWNVSQTELWDKFIGQKITDVKLTWEEVGVDEEKSGKPVKIIYPQDLRIVFSNNKSIFISAAEFLNENNDEVRVAMDNLTVTDNEYLARQVKMIN